MRKVFYIGLLFGAAGAISCGGFKLDSEKNCLNQDSSCFKWDRTDPAYVSANPTPGTQRTTLPTITLVFSEELKNGEDKSAYLLSGAGAQGLSIAAAKKISSLTYEISLNGSIVASAPIKLDFSSLKDYSNNTISGQTSITYAGNVAVGITGTPSHYGLGIGGYTDLTVTFQHNYSTDSENTWQISVTSGAVFCGAGTEVDKSAPGVYLASGVSQTSQLINYVNFGGAGALGAGVSQAHRVIVCVKNKNNANVQSLWSWLIIRDDSAPTISSATPVSDSYGSFQNFTVTCGDNAETIAYNSLAAATDPGPPINPTFDANGAINAGTGIAYTGPISVTNSFGNPTYTNFRTRCIDIAGHLSPAVLIRNYLIDTTIPAVNISLSGGYHTAVSNVAGAYNSTDLTFTTDQASPLQYKIIRGGANCADAGATILVNPTTLPATANTLVSNNLPVATPANFPTPQGTIHTIRICVEHPTIPGNWGPHALEITRDDVAPGFASGVTGLTNPNDGTVTLQWNPATDTSPIEAYEICQSTVAGACAAAFTATYQASGTATSFQVTGLNTSTTYYFLVRARDAAGNRDANVVEKKSRMSLGVTVAGYASAVADFRVSEGASTLIFTGNGTQTFSNVYASGNSFAINIINQPGGQHCAFVENQFGNVFADTTLNVTCVTGSSLAKRLQPNTAAPLNYNLYRGNATSLGVAGLFHPCEMTYTGGFLYFSDYTNENPPGTGLCSGNNCRIVRVNAASGALTTIAGTLSGVARGIATDGTNLYYTVTGQTGVYKIPVAGGTQLTVATGFTTPLQLAYSNNEIFVADGAGGGIKKISLATGQVTLVAPASNNRGMEIIGSTLYFVTTSHTINSVPVSGGTPVVAFGSTGVSGFRDGTSPLFNNLQDIVGDGVRNLYVTEYNNNVIRRIDLRNSRVTTISGRGVTGGFTAGVGPGAIIQNPVGIASDGRNLYANLHNVHRTIKITDSGLAGYWPIDPGVNPNDYSSDGAAVNNGTLVGGALSTLTDRFGSPNLASLFNGTTQYATAGTGGIPASMDQALTLAAWVNVTNLSTASAILGTGNFKFRFNIETNGGVLYQNWHSGGGGTKHLVSSSAGIILPNVWTHVAYIYVPGASTFAGGRIFVNGHDVTQSSTSVGPASDLVNVPLTIGYSTASATQNYMRGALADVRIYARALSEGELNELAQDAAAASVGTSFNSGATGLLSHYSFPGPSFLESRADHGALNSTLLLSGTFAAVTGKDGDPSAAAAFDGTNFLHGSAVGLPAGASPRTQCAWVKPSDYPTIIYSIMRYGDNGAPGGCSDLLMQDNAGTPSLAFGSCGASAAEYTTVNYSLPLNTWSHVCGTLAAGHTVNIYVNGVSVATTTGVTTNWQTNPAGMNLQIGNFNGAGGYAFRGSIDDVRIYNSALTQFQIRQLATQVPSGLMARYDFTGDRSDVSGFGQTLNNNGASPDVDRFGIANASARFTSGAYMDGTMARFPTGNQPRTVCAWTNPSVLFNGVFSEAVMYGTSSAGWGFGMDAAGGLPNGRFFILDAGGDLAYNMPHGLSIWRHVCSTHDGTLEQIYVDGASIAGVTRSLATASGSLFIGKGVFAGDFFNGNIDDVRIYNRALSSNEIQALQQQPNKRIFVTGMAYRGDLNSNYYWDGAPNSGAPTGATGIAGADAKCNWRAGDSAIPATGTYKAMLVDGPNRRACTSGNCASGGLTENIDWVLRNNISYVRSNLITPVFTTNFSTIFPLGTMTNPIITGLAQSWTGLSTSWLVANAGLDLDCADWGTGLLAITGGSGRTDLATGSALYNTTSTCNNNFLLYCVEQ